MKEKNWFQRFIAGIGIGIGAAIPGVSGAAIALIFRVYENILNAINGFKKNIKKSISTLLPILIGLLIAVIICVIVFHWAFEHCMFLLICIFAGFLLGSIPGLFDEVKGVKLTIPNLVRSIVAGSLVICLGILSIILGKNGIKVGTYFDDLLNNFWMFFILFVVGVIASVALAVPGFSGSLILLILGFYRPFIDNASLWGRELLKGDFSNTLAFVLMIVVFGIGCLVGLIYVSKLMMKRLTNHREATFYAIIGAVIGSVIVLFLNNQIWEYYLVWGGSHIEGITPTLSQDMEIPMGLLFIGIMAFFSFMLGRAQNNIQNSKKK